MSHSTHVGFNEPLMAFRPCDCRPSLRFAVGVGHLKCPDGDGFPRTTWSRSPLPPRSAIVAAGVGNKPDPVPPVRGTNGASRNAVPLRVIPARGQVSENSPESSSKES
jgi:hypothetical protein